MSKVKSDPTVKEDKPGKPDVIDPKMQNDLNSVFYHAICDLICIVKDGCVLTDENAQTLDSMQKFFKPSKINKDA